MSKLNGGIQICYCGSENEDAPFQRLSEHPVNFGLLHNFLSEDFLTPKVQDSDAACKSSILEGFMS